MNNYIFIDKKVTCNCLNLTVVNIALIIINVNSVNSKIKKMRKEEKTLKLHRIVKVKWLYENMVIIKIYLSLTYPVNVYNIMKCK